jgi:hypothetical protein
MEDDNIFVEMVEHNLIMKIMDMVILNDIKLIDP